MCHRSSTGEHLVVEVVLLFSGHGDRCLAKKCSSSIGSCRSCSNPNLASEPMIPRKGEAILAHVKKGLTKGRHAHAHTCTKHRQWQQGGGGAPGFCTFAKGRFFPKRSMVFNTLPFLKKLVLQKLAQICNYKLSHSVSQNPQGPVVE